jgi:hypothetical protein
MSNFFNKQYYQPLRQRYILALLHLSFLLPFNNNQSYRKEPRVKT